MKISVVIPTHKNIFLKETLLSLREQKGISINDYEVIVVENPILTEQTADLVNSMGINFYPLVSELGSNNARNTGIEASQSDIIAITDDDCVLCDTWVSQLIGLNGIFPGGVIGGPLLLDYKTKKPEWLVNDLEGLLSKMEMVEENGRKGPFNIKDYVGSFLVSANLSFSKKIWEDVGKFNGNIGYHGLGHRIGNDEIQFINKCVKKEGVMIYSPDLIAYHQIPEERLKLDYLKKRAYGQGFADALLWLEEYPEKTKNDIYHDFIQPSIIKHPHLGSILEARNKICNEDITREFIRILILSKIEYFKGATEALEQ